MSGLEAIGAAASIIQVADLGAKLSVKLFSFYQRVKNAGESVQLLSNEIALVSAILRELGDNLKGEDASKLCSKEAYCTLDLVLTQSSDVLQQIQKVVDDNDKSGKSRLQQMTGEVKLVFQESNLDTLKVSLERLKSTILLLLNVITYAGQIRRCVSLAYVEKLNLTSSSKNVPGLVQEQHDLIQTLLRGQHGNKQQPKWSNDGAGPEGPRDLDINTQRNQVNSTGTDSVFEPTLLNHNRFSRLGLRKRASQDPSRSLDHASNGPMDTNESDELKGYNSLIRSMLVEIESCKSKLRLTGTTESGMAF